MSILLVSVAIDHAKFFGVRRTWFHKTILLSISVFFCVHSKRDISKNQSSLDVAAGKLLSWDLIHPSETKEVMEDREVWRINLEQLIS